MSTFNCPINSPCLKRCVVMALITAANEVCEGYVFTVVCLSTGGMGGMRGKGACVVGGMCGRGACMTGGVCDRGCAWWEMCMAGGHAWQRGACMAEGGMHGRGCAWQRGMCGRGACVVGGGHVWQGVCMAGECA